MKKFYCNRKKDFCLRGEDCEASETQEKCEFFDGSGGEEIKAEDENDAT